MARLLGVSIAMTLALSGAGCVSCPTALLEGTLVADGQGGLAVRAPEGGIVPVIWQGDLRIGRDGDRLVLTNVVGLPIAHEGEFVSMAGGVPGDDPTFAACGPIAVSASGPPTQ